MASADDSTDEPFEPPKPSDGFNAPSDEVKRRNVITGLVILGLITMWVLFGFRDMLF